jgi:hypothetical protein
MADLLISRGTPGVSLIRSTDPFNSIEIFRIDRAHWQATPETAGVYLLYGVSDDGKLTVYVGMSITNMRHRIRSHHVNAKKNWFGTLFAVAVPTPLLCPAIEAELIGQLAEANVVDVIDNKADEHQHLTSDDVHVEPAVEQICDGLQLVLGSDIFTAPDEEVQPLDPPLPRLATLSRQNRAAASHPRPRAEHDPKEATRGWVGAGLAAWGHFIAAEPDKRFRVLAQSQWRRPNLNPNDATFGVQQKVNLRQEGLVKTGVLDEHTMTFLKHHDFDNWSVAAQTVRGKAAHSGAYHWQKLAGGSPGQ